MDIMQENNDWLMLPNERQVLADLITELHPQSILEIGCFHGEATHFYSTVCARVDSVDIQDRRLPHNTNLHGVRFFETDSSEFFNNNELIYDLIIVDAGHETPDAEKDMLNAIHCGKVIIAHDSFNPDCRKGYLNAINQQSLQYDLRYDLDFCLGTQRWEGPWGGFAKVTNKTICAR